MARRFKILKSFTVPSGKRYTAREEPIELENDDDEIGYLERAKYAVEVKGRKHRTNLPKKTEEPEPVEIEEEPVEPADEPDEEPVDLNTMKKRELMGFAEEHGIEVNQRMRKDEIRLAIEDALAT